MSRRQPPERGLGMRPSEPDIRDYTQLMSPQTLAKMPETCDLRPDFPFSVYDQGRTSACTAHAAAMLYRYERHRHQLPDLPPSRLFWYYLERAVEGTEASDAGARPRDACRVAQQTGITPEALWPFDSANVLTPPPANAYIAAGAHKIGTYWAIAPSLRQMQAALVEGRPFTLGVMVYDSFMSSHVEKTGLVPLPQWGESLMGGHDILVVGYQQRKHQFVFVNSWGPDWGDHGYGYLPYAYVLDPSLAGDRWFFDLAPTDV